MHLHFSAIIAVDRVTGKCEILSPVANLGPAQDGIGAILAKQAEILSDGEAGVAARKQYSHVLAIVDNHPRASYTFPDGAAEAAEELRAKRRSVALATRTENEKALAEHEKAAAILRGKLGSTPAAPVAPVEPAPAKPEPVEETAPEPAEQAGPVVTDRTPAGPAVVAGVETATKRAKGDK